MTNATSNNNSQSSMPAMGVFTPWKSGQNNKPRMAGEMLSDFAKGNVANVLGRKDSDNKEYNRDFRYGADNKDNTNVTVNTIETNTYSTPESSNAEQTQASSPVTYDEDKYRYYDSDFGSGTGAEAYAKDMEGYNNMVAMNEGDGLAAGHLGLVAQMMHPDWGRSQRAGGGAEAPEAQDYATKPQYAAGSKDAALFERKFGSGGASNEQSKQYSSNSSSSSSSSNGKLKQPNRSRGGWQ